MRRPVQRIRRGRLAPFAVALGMLALPLATPRGEPSLPRPGSAKTVSSLVAASTKIERLPSNLTPSLGQQSINDTPGAYYPATTQGCPKVTSCVFGDRSSRTTIVLFGDSHAYMWLPSLVAYATKAKVRLILVWMLACPAADVTVFNQQTEVVYTACNAFRSRSFAAIRGLKPALVLLASRTTQVEGANQDSIAQGTWQHGLEETVKAFKSRTTTVSIVGDIIQFAVPPSDCLASEQNHVQACSAPDPNPRITGHYAAEQRAARATHIAYVNPLRWLCASACSPVIGNMVAYYNDDHVSATYAAFLGTVFSTVVASLLPR